MSAIPTAVRTAVKARDFGRCCRCSSHGATDIHHRMRRRDGGHDLSNCILLCRECHAWAHANPAVARELGFIVSAWSTPEGTALKTWRGWVSLNDDGTLEFVPAPGMPTIPTSE